MEVILFGMIVSVTGIRAVGTNPPSDGVRYSNTSQTNATTVKGALDDLYTKVDSCGGSTCPTCPTCPTNVYKYYTFDKKATYTRTSTGTATILKDKGWARLCADNKDCTYTFTATLDVNINQLYACNVALIPDDTASQLVPVLPDKDMLPPIYHGRQSFRYSNGTTYYNAITASKTYNESRNRLYSSYIHAMHYNAMDGSNSIYTTCDVSGNKITMKLNLSNNPLVTYDNEFYLMGSIVYK